MLHEPAIPGKSGRNQKIGSVDRLHRLAGRDLSPPHPGGILEHPVRPGGLSVSLSGYRTVVEIDHIFSRFED